MSSVMSKQKMIDLAGRLGAYSGMIKIVERVSNMKLRPYVRIVSYHDIPPASESQMDKQLAYFAKHYEPANFDDIRGLVKGKPWGGG